MSKLKFIKTLASGNGGHKRLASAGQREAEPVVSNSVTRPLSIPSAWHGLVLLVSLSLLATCVTSSQTPDSDWGDEDTIVIEADNEIDSVSRAHVRVKREASYVPATFLRSNDVTEGDACLSPKGMQGKCVPLKMCYTFMYQYDLKNDGIYAGNMELANSLRETVGSCVDLESSSNIVDFRSVFFGFRTKQPDLICCTGNYTKIEIPPMVLPLIVGGQRAQQGQFPSMAAIMNNGRQFCGGSILDSTHVLTAAHCIAHMGGSELSRVTLQIGDHAIYSTSDGPHQTKKVARLSKHKQFSSTTLHNDIAILTLSSPISYNSKVRAISPSSSGGSTATVAGWGRLYDGGMFPSVLYYVNVNIVPNSSCKQTYGSRAPGGIISSMVCAGSRAGDACSGDSGGPLMVGGSQIGIVSWGIGCGGYPGVYTRVSSFLPWIQKNQRH